MVKGNIQWAEEHLKSAFESGFSHAASSLEKMLDKAIALDSFHFGNQKLDFSHFSAQESEMLTKQGKLITTELFGEVIGKSYLLLSEDEVEQFMHLIAQGKFPNMDIKEEFIKELDNILSASVITMLSNRLQLKMYGDIPRVVKEAKGAFHELVTKDFAQQTNEVYISSISFTLVNYPNFRPTFIWVLDSQIAGLLEIKSAS